MSDVDRTEASALGTRRTLVVVNPRSAAGGTERRWNVFADTLREAIGTFEYRFTRSVGDGATLAREGLRQGFEMIVAMGGDGTINEVANGFFDGDQVVNPEAIMGVVPAGTGGDFRRTLAIPKTVSEAAKVLRGRGVRRIDVGRLEYTAAGGARAVRRFINIASFGISGVVDELVNRSRKGFGGRVAFAAATLRAAWSYRNQRVRLACDGEAGQELTVQNVAVANGQYFGGGMRIAPDARLDDGVFDVVVIGDLGFSELLRSGHRVYRGTHLGMPKITHRRASRVAASPASPGERVLLDVDGENPGMLPATFTLEPRALRIKMRE
jgi:YegS/Rv2252/BmrU family lipid kinase